MLQLMVASFSADENYDKRIIETTTIESFDKVIGLGKPEDTTQIIGANNVVINGKVGFFNGKGNQAAQEPIQKSANPIQGSRQLLKKQTGDNLKSSDSISNSQNEVDGTLSTVSQDHLVESVNFNSNEERQSSDLKVIGNGNEISAPKYKKVKRNRNLESIIKLVVHSDKEKRSERN